MSRRPPEIAGPVVPADEAAEKVLIGTLLFLGNEPVDGGRTVWDQVRRIEHMSGQELFNLLHLRRAWEVIRRRAKAGLEFQAAVLVHDPEGKAALEALGSAWAAFISENNVPHFVLPEIVDKAEKASAARTAHKVLSEALEMLGNHPGQAQSIVRHAAKALGTFGTVQADFPAPLRLGEWLAKPRLQRPEIIRGLLRQGDKLTLGGASKSYKTWLVSDLALCVSVGKPWMGFETVKSPVGFLNLELPEDTFHSRMEILCGALGIRSEEADFVVWNLRGCRVSIERIEENLQARGGELRLLVLDPLYKVLGDRKENDAGDMAELMGHLEAIATRHGCALVIPAHYSKGNQSEKEAIDRISGSGVFARDADAIVTLTAHEQPGCLTVESTLRAFAPVNPFVIRWGFPLFQRDDDVDPNRLKKGGRREKIHSSELLSLLEEKGLTFTEWRQAAETRLGIPKTSFGRKRTDLLDAGLVAYNGETQRYFKRVSK